MELRNIHTTFFFRVSHQEGICPLFSPDGDEYHGEDEVLPEEGDDQRGRRDDLDHEQEEHVQAGQDRNGEGHLQSGMMDYHSFIVVYDKAMVSYYVFNRLNTQPSSHLFTAIRWQVEREHR